MAIVRDNANDQRHWAVLFAIKIDDIFCIFEDFLPRLLALARLALALCLFFRYVQYRESFNGMSMVGTGRGGEAKQSLASMPETSKIVGPYIHRLQRQRTSIVWETMNDKSHVVSIYRKIARLFSCLAFYISLFHFTNTMWQRWKILTPALSIQPRMEKRSATDRCAASKSRFLDILPYHYRHFCEFVKLSINRRGSKCRFNIDFLLRKFSGRNLSF